VGESHTRNLFYLESLHKLHLLLNKAGYDVRIGMLPNTPLPPEPILLPSGAHLTFSQTERVGWRLVCHGFDPCLIILNNDLSGGIPDDLTSLEQEIVPPLALGWSSRYKSTHFAHYSEVVGEFSRLVKIDPWLIEPLYRNCGDMDLKKRQGESCITDHVRQLKAEVLEKYHQHGIEEPPFIVVKADQGTYGMGIIMVEDADNFSTLNRNQRKKLSSLKEGMEVSQVIIQEGVHTHETVGDDNAVAEPVIYMIGHFVVGGFYRVHKQRSATENLNAPGMHFEPLAFAESCTEPDQALDPDTHANRFYAYGVIARLALLAAAREISEAASAGTVSSKEIPQ
jgi:glutamate--cysteine ligase